MTVFRRRLVTCATTILSQPSSNDTNIRQLEPHLHSRLAATSIVGSTCCAHRDAVVRGDLPDRDSSVDTESRGANWPVELNDHCISSCKNGNEYQTDCRLLSSHGLICSLSFHWY